MVADSKRISVKRTSRLINKKMDSSKGIKMMRGQEFKLRVHKRLVNEMKCANVSSNFFDQLETQDYDGALNSW